MQIIHHRTDGRTCVCKAYAAFALAAYNIKLVIGIGAKLSYIKAVFCRTAHKNVIPFTTFAAKHITFFARGQPFKMYAGFIGFTGALYGE